MLSEVPEGWQQKKLTEYFDVKSSKRVLQKQWRKQGIPFYRGREITALSERGSVDNELFIEEELYKTFAEKSGVPSKDDILITAIGTIGNTYCVKENERFYFKDASVLWLSKKAEVNSLFINYWLNSASFKNQLDSGNGTTVDSLTIKQLSSSHLLMPPLTEQKRITDVLSSVDESIQATQRLIEQAERVKQGLMEELLTGGLGSEAIERGEVPEEWSSAKLLDLLSGSVFTDGDWVESKDQSPDGRVRLIQLADIGDGAFIDKSDRHLTEDAARRLNCTFLREGDLLVARMPEPLGRCCRFPLCGDEKFVTVVDVAILRPTEKFDASWLMNLMNSSYARKYIEDNASGTTRKRISRKNLGALNLPIPPLTEQKRIAEVLSSVDDRVKRLKEELEELGRLKKGLMDDLLTGKVRTV